jgi:hypothetical protein
MDTFHDRVALTVEEQRVLAALERAADRHGRRLRLSMALAARTVGARSRRTRDIQAALLFLTGATVMVATFTRWPPVAVAGVVMQAVALWWAISRLGRQIDARASARAAQAPSEAGPSEANS